MIDENTQSRKRLVSLTPIRSARAPSYECSEDHAVLMVICWVSRVRHVKFTRMSLPVQPCKCKGFASRKFIWALFGMCYVAHQFPLAFDAVLALFQVFPLNVFLEAPSQLKLKKARSVYFPVSFVQSVCVNTCTFRCRI